MASRIINADVMSALPQLPDGSINCCVTSPPYFGLRDYGNAAQIGLEQTPDAYVSKLVAVFREVRRVLRDDGTIWVNLGDSYSAGGRGGGAPGSKQASNSGTMLGEVYAPWSVDGFKPKNLLGIPWRVAFALQADGWYLRQDIIWHKPNPMPESVTDRCTKAHEYLFLLEKSERYHYDHTVIMEPAQYGQQHASKTTSWGTNRKHPNKSNTADYAFIGDNHTTSKMADGSYGRNRRSVWTIPTQPYSGAHFATFPPALVEPCILAGCPDGGTVLDPFCGSGTTLAVAEKHGRHGIGIELNPDYIPLIEKRLAEARTLFTDHTIRPPALSTEAGGFFTGP